MNFPLNMRVRAAGLIIEEDSILLIEYYTEDIGLHYVLPGGGVETGETIREALVREVREETCLPVAIGPLVFAYEYAPHLDPVPRNIPPAVTMVFACKSQDGRARLPDCPDKDQIGVRWLPLDELDTIRLSPPVQKHIVEYAYGGKTRIDWIEEWRL